MSDRQRFGRESARRRRRESRTPSSPRLPLRPLRGEFVIAEAALAEAERLLPTYRSPVEDHEGIIFLLGVETGETTVLTSVLAPHAESGPGRVHCTTAQMTQAAHAAREAGLGILAQVHSHPCGWAEHSVGDDEMVFMPFEQMLSIVAPWYGKIGLRPLENLGVHQFQEGRWVRAEQGSIREQITVVPTGIDLR